jgi:serine/threonine protein kinase
MDLMPDDASSPVRERQRQLIRSAQAQLAGVEPAVSIHPPPTSRSSTDGSDPVFDSSMADSFTGYHIQREIHRGGQGVVYQALQRSTNRRVAIKVMRDAPFGAPGDVARFEREVQVLGQLQHPNIVTIHDSGSAAGHFYFVMDYISGQALDTYMAGARHSVKETLKLFAIICESVNAAHLRGITHRDLKPSNIRVDEAGRPHILDFGLAKLATSDADARVVTITGQFVGSLPWASPEQAEASPAKIDLRTDVYSLGVILYQMLTGKFPYDVIGPMREVQQRIMHSEPVRPRILRNEVDDEGETIVLKCLHKERERRYQTAGELARDVRRETCADIWPVSQSRPSAMR